MAAVAQAEAASPPIAVDEWGPVPHRGVYASLLLVSTALLALEVSFTRLFSYTVWYHLAYLTISVALLGFGASGAIVAAFPRLFGRGGERRLIAALLGAAALTAAALVFLTRYPLEVTDLMARPVPFALGLLAYYVAVGMPFLLAGFAIGVPFAAYPTHMSRLYFWDLLGAAIGCLAAVLGIEALGVPGLILGAAALLVAGAAALAFGSGRRGTALALATVALAGLALARPLGRALPIAVTPSKGADARGPIGRADAYSQWTALNRVDAYGWAKPMRIQFWGAHGLMRGYKGPVPETARLTYDGGNGSAIYAYRGSFDDFRMLEHHLLRTPYVIRTRPRVLVIGVGGGIDMMNAIKQGAAHVTGVELQPKTVELLSRRLRDFTGGFYDRPDVRLVASEGRHFVRKSTETFDLMQITAVDTYAAQATGAYVLAESYIYTVEAMEDYLAHLGPDGLLSIVVGDPVAGNEMPPVITRLALVARRALERAGIAAPEAHLMVVDTATGRETIAMGDVLAKKSPFTAEEIAAVTGFAREKGFRVLFAPGGGAEGHPLSELLGPDHAARERALEASWFRLDPVHDDDPFFFNLSRWRNLSPSNSRDGFFGLAASAAGSFLGQAVLLLMVAQSLVLGLLLVVLPLLRGGRESLRQPAVASYLAYFLALGIGFMFIEISFVQSFVLFLGSPTHALSVTIFALLLFSSLGSRLSGRFVAEPARALRLLVVLVVALVTLYAFALRAVFDAALHLPMALRVAIAIAAQAPMGLVLGMFMPLGVACVARVQPRLVPWAWGLNGVGSVVGTTMAVVLAMSWGFTVVAVCAAVLYVVGTTLMLRSPACEARSAVLEAGRGYRR